MDARWYRQLGARVARLRSHARLTQELLAERADIAASYLARIETGTRRPTLDVLGRLADALGVTIQRLIADERTVRAGDGHESLGRPARQLSLVVLDLDDTDVELLLRVAHRLRDR